MFCAVEDIREADHENHDRKAIKKNVASPPSPLSDGENGTSSPIESDVDLQVTFFFFPNF